MTQVSRSANEVAMMVQKACLGSKVPVSQAQLWGRAMAAFGDAESLQCLVQHLGVPPTPPEIQATESAVSFKAVHIPRDFPVACDACNAGVEMVRIDQPSDAAMHCFAKFAAVQLHASSGEVSITKTTAQNAPAQRLEIADMLWNALNNFAAQTYVPETDASRMGGAGAGLTDND